jgi:hypothetical protein
MADLTPPVPPDELIEPSKDQLTQFLVGLAGCHSIASKRMFVRQWVRDWTRYKLIAQAIPEREELAQLLMELGQEVEEEADALCSGENIHPETESHAGNLRELRDRARAAAERLGEGSANG